MIIVKMSGGLGNQMFEYAFGKSLSLKYKQSLFLDISAYKRKNKNTFRKFSLDIFNIHGHILNSNLLSGLFTFIDLIGKKFFKNDFITKETEEQVFKYNSNLKVRTIIPNDYYGYWQSFKYFEQFKENINADFTSLIKPAPEFVSFQGKINNCESVSIHVRRGDYVGNRDYEVCTLEYYQNAINFFEKQFTKAVFFVFSDDPSWVKNNLKFKNDFVVVSGNSCNENEELLLMSNCKCNIISNSSFSWWAAWLNNNLNKKVIVPSRWMNVPGWESVPDLIPSDWIKL